MQMAKFKIKKPQYPLDDQTRQIIKLTRWTSINFPTLETITTWNDDNGKYRVSSSDTA